LVQVPRSAAVADCNRAAEPAAPGRLRYWTGRGSTGRPPGRGAAGLQLPKLILELAIAELQLFVLAGELPQLVLQPLDLQALIGIVVARLLAVALLTGSRLTKQLRGYRRCRDEQDMDTSAAPASE
jgi:hypothetical protein